MLHDLLFTLLGVQGELLNQSHINPLLKKQLHPSEWSTCTRFLSLGTIYSQIQSKLKTGNGLYFKTLSFTVQNILKDYQKTVLELEKRILQGFQPSASFLESTLSVHRFQLVYLNELIDLALKSKNLVSDLIVQQSLHGNPIIKDLLDDILSMQLKLLLNQIKIWLQDGQIQDVYLEFFIFKNSDLDIHMNGWNICNEKIPHEWMSTETAQDILLIGNIVYELQFHHSMEILKEWKYLVESILENGFVTKYEFKDKITRLKSHISGILKEYILNKGSLFYYLSWIRDVYLYGHADLFVALTLDYCTVDVVSMNTDHVNTILREYKVPSEFEFNSNQQISFDISLKPSLKFLIQESHIQQLNTLFRFLHFVKSVKLESSAVFKSRMECALYRQVLIFLDSLWSFIQMDVIQPEYIELINFIKQESDFTRIQTQFATFFINLNRKLFLSRSIIQEKLVTLLQTCMEIGEYCSQSSIDKDFPKYKGQDKCQDKHKNIKTLNQEFQNQIHFLFQVWSALPDCLLLVTRLDGNHWYSLQKTYPSSS